MAKEITPRPIRTERRGVQSQVQGVRLGFLNSRLNERQLQDACGFPLRVPAIDEDDYSPILKKEPR